MDQTTVTKATGTRRFTDDGGAVLVEAALITPLFVYLLFGILEFGGAFRDYLTTSNAASSATRAASIWGSSIDADYQTMRAVQKASTAMPLSQIDYIVVWKATGSEDTVPAACREAPTANGGTASSPAIGACNRYSGSHISAPSSTWTCSGSDPIRHYCPTGRRVSLDGAGPDYLGVYVSVTHPWVTGLFGSSITMSEQSITKLEPQTLVS